MVKGWHRNVMIGDGVTGPMISLKKKTPRVPGTASNRIQSLIRPAKNTVNIFASVLEWYTRELNISLKHLFAAQWGVFAA